MGQVQSDESESEGGGRPQDPDGLEAQQQDREKASQPGQASVSATNKQKKKDNQKVAKKSERQQQQQRQHDKPKTYRQNLLSALGNITGGSSGARGGRQQTAADKMTLEHQYVRKLSNVSNRNIQLLSMSPRNEQDNYAEGLRSRRRSSLINLILGAPSRGPRFSDDLCSLSSHMSELCNFGIDYFPDAHGGYSQACRTASSIASSSISRDLDKRPGSVTWRPSSLAVGKYERHHGYHGQHGHHHHHSAAGDSAAAMEEDDISLGGGINVARRHRRRSSLGSLAAFEEAAGLRTSKKGQQQQHQTLEEDNDSKASSPSTTPAEYQNQLDTPEAVGRKRPPSLASIFLASIDLTSSFSDGDSQQVACGSSSSNIIRRAPPLARSRQTIQSESSDSGCSRDSLKLVSSATNGRLFSRADNVAAAAATMTTPGRDYGRINHNARRIIHRSGSELSLYSSTTLSGSLSRLGSREQELAATRGSISSGGGGGRSSVALAGGSRAVRLPLSSSSCTELASKIPRRVWSSASSKKDAAATASASSLALSRCQIGNNIKPTRAANSTANTTDSDDSADCGNERYQSARLRETKWIIMLQVCLPFILAGFGNMAAGLALNRMAHWDAFHHVPIFFVLLPSFVGLKGNIEMTLASRLSTLSNLNLLDTGHRRRHAFLTNLVLILSQAIGLSIFAAFASVLCESFMGKLELGARETIRLSVIVVLPAALITSIFLVIISSLVMWLSIWLARRLQVNPDNLSTLVAALYGDVSCVLTYGLFAQLMYSLNQQGLLVWPVTILAGALISWPVLWYAAYASKETRELSLSSMPPMLAAIMVSLGSGAVLSLVVGRFNRIALYQPVVNGFGANLIAAQASRVSTWLWCNAVRRLSTHGAHAASQIKGQLREPGLVEMSPGGQKVHVSALIPAPYGSLASVASTMTATSAAVNESPAFTRPTTFTMFSKTKADDSQVHGNKHKLNIGQRASQVVAEGNKQGARTRAEFAPMKLVKLILWSFFNSSPNSVAARLLLLMLVPAHSLYFIVIWLLSPPGYITLTWSFYIAYVSLCLVQVFILLLICEPMMTLLMSRRLDPDIFGISLLMALADLIGTLCLTGAFTLLASMRDPNA